MTAYKQMTQEQRMAAYGEQREAANLHQDMFCQRPFNPRNRADLKAWKHMQSCEREAAFIRRVARSCGDAWAA